MAQLSALQAGNWQRGGGKGAKPKPIKLPEDKEIKVHSIDELAAKRRRQSEHLKRRRAQRRKSGGE